MNADITRKGTHEIVRFRGPSEPQVREITQHQLAVIQQLQSELADLEEQLYVEMNALRKLIRAGAHRSPGPLRFFVRKGGKIEIK